MIEWLKVILLGIVEGITEWLPISSTGHLILVDEFVKLNQSDAFMEMFNVVIQLGAIPDLRRGYRHSATITAIWIRLSYGLRLCLPVFLPW